MYDGIVQEQQQQQPLARSTKLCTGGAMLPMYDGIVQEQQHPGLAD